MTNSKRNWKISINCKQITPHNKPNNKIPDYLLSRSNQCLDSTGNKLLFIIKKGTEEHLFWKVTIRIACVKVDPKTQKIHSFKLIDLRKFLQIYRTLKVQKEIADESKQHDLTVSTIYNNLEEIAGRSDEDVESATECCICLERKPDISLPCAHTYCVQCIEEW